VDPFHLVKLGNDMLTAVRRRVSWDRHDRRGRKADPAWAHRLLRLRGYNSLSDSWKAKLDKVLRVEDPTQEIRAAGASRKPSGSRSCRPRWNWPATIGRGPTTLSGELVQANRIAPSIRTVVPLR